MRSPPVDLSPEQLRTALAEGWGLTVASMEYVPKGGGSHHWKVVDEDGTPQFVNVDDLDSKDWLGETRDAVFDGFGRALATASALRHRAGLAFAVAPIAARDGRLLLRLDARYTVSLFPFLTGRSFSFGPYPNSGLRDAALDLLVALHRSTSAVRALAPRHVPGFGGRQDLAAFLVDPDRPWDGGTFSEAARRLLAAHGAGIARLVVGFDRQVARTAPTRAEAVITHGEPHPGNLMFVHGRLLLIDWDTAGLACPERDLALVVGADGEGVDRYQQATGRAVDPTAITLYRVRWYLDDLASTVRLFRNHHGDTPDTRRWWAGLAPRLAQLPTWLDVLG